MKKSVAANKKSRGRPKRPGGVDPVSAVRLPEDITAEVDAWAVARELTRSEAIRQLVEIGLASAHPSGRLGKKGAAKASKLAGETINHLIDKSAPTEEQKRRMERLLKGPPEFRDMRRGHPKAKS